MPRGNGTGPDGMGPMTGRGAGYCAGYNIAGCMNNGAGRGLGRGRSGMGRGFGRGRGMAMPGVHAVYSAAQPAPMPDMGLDALKNQVRVMEETLQGARRRIEELERAAGPAADDKTD